jgi:regulator of protease activity HflC (stomatin/prohibitin superfamily)
MRIVVREWERVLVYRDGAFVEQLEPGRHRRPLWRRTRVVVVVRPRQLLVPTQEVLTGDGLPVKISVTAALAVVGPQLWHEAVERPEDFLYTALQVALRDAVAVRTLDEVLADRSTIGADLTAAVAGRCAAVGASVTDVALRDVVVPAELRRAAAEVVTARTQGLAALERARSEVAATRALANAAKMVADSPGLLQLRTLQAVEAGRATVVLTQG